MAAISDVLVRIRASAASFEKDMQRIESRMYKTGRVLSGVGRNLSQTLTLPILATGGAALKAAADYEQLETRMSGLLGSAEEGAKTFKKLKDFAAATPFQLTDIVQANNQLLAFGLGAEQAFEATQMLGDIAAGTGSNMSDLALILGQAKSIGAAYTMDLRQLAQRGVPIYESLQQVLGVTGEELGKMVTEGKISFEILQEAMRQTTVEGGLFFNATSAQSKTLSGVFSTFKDNVTDAFATLGQEIAKTVDLQALMQRLIDKIKAATEWFKQLPDPVKKAILVITAIAAAIGPVLVALGSMNGLIRAGITIVGLLSKAFVAFALNPVGAVLLAIGAIVLLVVDLNKALSEVEDKMGELGDWALGKGAAILQAFNPAGAASMRAVSDLRRKERREQEAGVTPSVLVGANVGAEQEEEVQDAARRLAQQMQNAFDENPVTPTVSFDDEEKRKDEEGGLNALIEDLNSKISEGIGKGLEETFIDPKITEEILEFDNALKGLNETLDELQGSGLEGLSEEFQMVKQKADESAEKMKLNQQVTDLYSKTLSTVKPMLTAAGQGFQQFGRTVAATVAKVAKAYIVEAIAAAIKNSFTTSGNPLVGAVMAGIAAGGISVLFDSLISKVNAPALAQGGLAFGPTMAMVGDNTSASVDPEVIAPLSRLKEMIGGGGFGNTTGEFRIDYNTLDLLLTLRDERNVRIG